MNAEQMELARRFVACKGWVWLPGMLCVGHWPDEVRDVEGLRMRAGRIADCGFPLMISREVAGKQSWLPDLSDALTRAGLLEVVRQALGVPNLTPIIGADGWYLHGIPDDRPELWWSSGRPSELHALLAALEAAPGV